MMICPECHIEMVNDSFMDFGRPAGLLWRSISKCRLCGLALDGPFPTELVWENAGPDRQRAIDGSKKDN